MNLEQAKQLVRNMAISVRDGTPPPPDSDPYRAGEALWLVLDSLLDEVQWTKRPVQVRNSKAFARAVRRVVRRELNRRQHG